MVRPFRSQTDVEPVIEPEPSPLGLLCWNLQPLTPPYPLGLCKGLKAWIKRGRQLRVYRKLGFGHGKLRVKRGVIVRAVGTAQLSSTQLNSTQRVFMPAASRRAWTSRL